MPAKPPSPTAAVPRAATRFEASSLLALAAALLLIVGAVAATGTLGAFLDLPSVLIVLGGTVAVTAVSFPLDDILAARRAMMRALLSAAPDPQAAARSVLHLAEIARRRGALVLQHLPSGFDPFLVRAINLVVDGPPEEAERIMGYDRAAASARQAKSVAILRRASEVAPAMGLIGTLVGLVQMLGSLDQPAHIGPSMALALVTTLYGALLANVVFAPLASKMERNGVVEDLVRQIYTLGALSIARQENPRRLELVLNTVLPPGNRLRMFD
ncbi:MAG: MotA/TolQ/ExbB proton channel family protein [Rhodospirillaceae bacterium]|nr:MotA/TolQ/ExbB proton channel family protein [Rhodospirillaceae bacterium]